MGESIMENVQFEYFGAADWNTHCLKVAGRGFSYLRACIKVIIIYHLLSVNISSKVIMSYLFNVCSIFSSEQCQ